MNNPAISHHVSGSPPKYGHSWTGSVYLHLFDMTREAQDMDLMDTILRQAT